jgi:hypothetical protein
VVDHFGKAYVDGNVVEGYPEVSSDNWKGGVQPDSVAPAQEVLPSIRSVDPIPYARIPLQSAEEAFESVLQNAGAKLPRRDRVDMRVVETVRSGKTTAKAGPDVARSLENPNFNQAMIEKMVHEISLGIITHPSQVGGYPDYKGEPYSDGDADGLPDAWEQNYGLNPGNALDAMLDSDDDGYANVEEFLNGTDPREFVDYTDLANNFDQ